MEMNSQNQLEELGTEDLNIEVYEVSSSTVLDEMGASVGAKNCCSVVTPTPN